MPGARDASMKILIVYYSRTGYTGTLAERIARELQLRSHTVVLERLEVVEEKSKWNLLLRQVYQYPIVACTLLSSRFRRWWLLHYPQPEDDIQPPAHLDVSQFDHVCIGGPKWCYISYPVATYLRQVKGLRGTRVSVFATFGGPPFEVFELELLFEPMRRRVEGSGGVIVATLGLSSVYHELFVLGVFKQLTRIKFGRPLESFSIDSEYGKAKITQFCDKICG
jgi:hypothetical protein